MRTTRGDGALIVSPGDPVLILGGFGVVLDVSGGRAFIELQNGQQLSAPVELAYMASQECERYVVKEELKGDDLQNPA